MVIERCQWVLWMLVCTWSFECFFFFIFCRVHIEWSVFVSRSIFPHPNVRFTIKNVNLLQVAFKKFRSTNEKKCNVSICNTIKIAERQHLKRFSFAYDCSRWHILNMAFKFHFIRSLYARCFFFLLLASTSLVHFDCIGLFCLLWNAFTFSCLHCVFYSFCCFVALDERFYLEFYGAEPAFFFFLLR